MYPHPVANPVHKKFQAAPRLLEEETVMLVSAFLRKANVASEVRGADMFSWTFVLGVLCFTSVVLGIFTLLRVLKLRPRPELTTEEISKLLRNESDRSRLVSDEQARALRKELGDSVRGFQETTLKLFRELSDSVGSEITKFDNRLEKGVRAIDDRAAEISSKVDTGLARLGEEATKNRDSLRQVIEGKLDASVEKQGAFGRELRDEMTGSFRRLGTSVSETLTQLSEQQRERLERVTASLSALSEQHERSQDALKQTLRQDLTRLEAKAR